MNNRGFATISLVFLAPFLVAATFGVFYMLWFIDQKNKVNNICYESVLKAQEELVSGNNFIMSMNGVAQFLYVQKKVLNKTIPVTPMPAKAALVVARNLIIAQQTYLGYLQKATLQKSNVLSNYQQVVLQKKFHKATSEIKKFWGAPALPFATIYSQPKSSQIQIKIKDIASVYYRRTDHSSSQMIQGQWFIPIDRWLPDWFVEIIPIQMSWSGQCASHPHKGGSKWQAASGQGNH